ncbi:MAG: hypothetical protein IT463_09220 [Planctomycetes bacterium]|nr:hypothetical protein [Planctomycetota bacterium]
MMQEHAYVFIPVAAALVAWVALFWAARQAQDDAIHVMVRVLSACTGAYGIFMTVALAMLTYVPGRGTHGPVQFWGSDIGDSIVWELRMKLLPLLLISVPASIVQSTTRAFARARKPRHNRLPWQSGTALLLLVLVFVATYLSGGRWLPTV